MTPLAHLSIINNSLTGLQDLLEVPKEQWTKFHLLRATAHLAAIETSAKAITEFFKAHAEAEDHAAEAIERMRSLRPLQAKE